MSDAKYDSELCERLVADIRAEVARTPYAAHRAEVADQLEAAQAALNHAIVENLAFNVKVSGEISETRAEREYWRTQTAIMLAKACTGGSSECAIRQRCTNKCGRLQQLDDAYRAARRKP